MTSSGLKTKLEYSDYVHIPSDGKRYELLEGVLHVTPAPSPIHQRVSKRLQRMLEACFETKGRGEVFNAPIDVILTNRDVVQPDLVLVTNAEQISTRGIEGPPFLLVEVLSPSTREYDRTAKAARYAALGVVHYWIVDPDAQQVECYRAAEGTFTLIAQAQGPVALSHPDWLDCHLPIADLWA
jgi:Uma2 family endonuclease